MKPKLLVLLALCLLIVSCSPKTVETATKVCRVSCDDILAAAGKTSTLLDDAARAAGSAGKFDDAGRLFSQADDHMDDLGTLLRRDIAVQEYTPFQLTDDILRTSQQSSDDLQRLRAWAGENQAELEFYANLVCAYRDATNRAWMIYKREATWEELAVAFMGRYGNAPPDIDELQQEWNRLATATKQEGINIWDTSITLYCTISDLKP